MLVSALANLIASSWGPGLPQDAVGESPVWQCMPVIPARGNEEKDP